MIHTKDLTMRFGDKEVLGGVDLDIEKGMIYGLLGPSGAGKTTLIKILTGQLTPTSGEVQVLGKTEELTNEDKKDIGIMMDSFGVYNRFSCYDNLKIFADIQGVSKKRIMTALEEVGLKDAAKTPADKLSKGMRNRLQLARVIMRSPKIMFLDEPTSALDPVSTEKIHNLILEKKDEGCTIFLTTHNMNEAYKLCDRIALLNEGKIVEEGVPEEICRKYNRDQKFIVRLKNGEIKEFRSDKTDTLGSMISSGQVETIHSSEPDLEKVFLTLTGSHLNV